MVSWVQGDIVEQGLDAIVNAANEDLAGGSGVCGAIFSAAGWDDMAAACRAVAPCPTGEARSTPGFALAAHHVIHAVGPVWHGGTSGEEDLLRSAYRSALDEAVRLGVSSIAVPVLSTGVYGYPLEDGCRVAWEELGAAPASLTDVRLVAFDAATISVLGALAGH